MRIDYLIREIEAIKIDLDLNTGEPTNVPEFRVFTKSEEENKHNHSKHGRRYSHLWNGFPFFHKTR